MLSLVELVVAIICCDLGHNEDDAIIRGNEWIREKPKNCKGSILSVLFS